MTLVFTPSEDSNWVRVMADYSSDGFWWSDGTMRERESMPLSPALLARHLEWCNSFELDLDLAKKLVEHAAFSAEGFEIARAIKAELTDWTVIYFDEAKAIAAPDPKDRASFEYEIIV